VHIVALTTCHNRRAITMASLADLHGQELPANVSLSITIVDDGSTDGTADAVRAAYPGVRIVRGDGSLYWAGGMRHGWEQCVKHQKLDALLVFNDDVRLKTNAVRELLETDRYAQALHGPLVVVSGAFTNLNGSEITYGGYRQTSRLHRLRFSMVAPKGTPCQIDTLNMNCALISAKALHEVGFLADYFRHAGADNEFGLRLRKAGGTVWLTPSAIGTCDRNPAEYDRLSAREQYRYIMGVKGDPPYIRARIFRDHDGLLWPAFWAAPYLRILAGFIKEAFRGNR
jgi:GT2 family glycosyltransferase